MQPKPLRIALVGNPNTGKTTLFNTLSGLRQRVGNYPGVTVELMKGTWKTSGASFDLIDLPGTYSLAPRSPDEMVAVDLLLGQATGEPRPDAVIAVVDAANLDRHLYLVTQLLEVQLPVVVALNMIDVAQDQQIVIDVPELEERLGVPVVPMQANKKIGIDRLPDAIARAIRAGASEQFAPLPAVLIDEATGLAKQIIGAPEFMMRRLLLDVGGSAEQRYTAHRPELLDSVNQARDRIAAAGHPVAALEARARYGWIRTITAATVRKPERPPLSKTDRIDRVLTHRVWGSLIFLTVMSLLFQSIFFMATPAMEMIKGGIGWLGDFVREALLPGPFASLLADGIIEGVGGVVVFLPQILILFGFLAILEDCGYMARAAFLMDKLMSRCGLSGKSFIPMLSSVACAVPGVMATRVIENPRDRLTTILVAPLMSCSARLPVYTLLIAAFLTSGYPGWVPGFALFAMYAIGIVLAPLVAWALKRSVLHGPTPPFIMEMPQYQWPSAKSVLLRMLDRAKAFLVRAGTMILASMVLVWALLYFPVNAPDGQSYDLKIAELRAAAEREGADKEALEKSIAEMNGQWRRQSILGQIGRAIEPVVKPLGWDWKIGMAAVASFPAREVVVGVLGQIYNLGRADAETLKEPLGQALKEATWNDEPGGRPVFSAATALSVMVFFALCCQCASTLAVIRRETGGWKWPIFTFVYMTVLAYVAALVVYQVGSRL